MQAEAYRVLVVDPTEAGERLAQRLSDRGLTAQCARSAAEALDLLIRDKPDLAIVEMHLPDASGADLVLILSGEVKTPVFLASPGRLPAEDGEFENLVNSVDGFFAKPYQLDEILPVLASALNTTVEALRQNSGAEVERSGQRWGYEDLHSEDSALNRVERDAQGEVLLLDEIVDEAEEAPNSAEETAEAEDIVSETSTKDLGLERLWEQKIASYKPAPARLQTDLGPRFGRLEAMPVARLFDMFYRAKRSGELGLVRGKAKRLIVFDHGNPVFARSNIAGERLGIAFVKRGLINDAQLAQAVETAGGLDQRVGQVLLEQNLITERQRNEVLMRAVTRVVMASFAWRDGEYSIGLVERVRSEGLTAPLFAGNVILRALDLVTDAKTLHREIPDDGRYAPSAEPPYPVERLKLTDVEARVLISADGTKTVQDLETLFDYNPRKLRGFLYGLVQLGVIELVGHGAAKPREISFF